MKSSLLLVAALSSILGGMGGAWLTHSLLGDDDRAEKERAARPGANKRDTGPSDLDDDDQGEDADEDPAARIRSLEHRVSLLTAALSRNGAVVATSGDDGKSTPPISDVADPVFEAAVLDIVDREQERKEGERETHRKELRERRAAQFSERLHEKLNLDTAQREQIAAAISKYFDSIQQMRDDESPSRPVTRKDWRERMDALSQETEKSLAQVLSPEQLKAYRALEDDEKITFGRGFGQAREQVREERR